MIILFDPIFGHGKMIVFHFVEWIGRNKVTSKKIYRRFECAFPMPAIPTRHEVTCKPKCNKRSFFSRP